jgi:phosphoglycerol transferase MdoB-like AlkP superfamily enzyme
MYFMKVRLFFIVRYFILWTCAFVIAKLIFMIYQHSQSFSLSPGIWIKVFLHGLKLDLSTAGYFTLFPALVLALTSFFNYKPAYYIVNCYTALMIFIFLIITFVDFEAYKYWGARLDSTPLRFLAKPKETLASTSIITLVIYLVSLSVLSWLLFKAYLRFAARAFVNTKPSGIKGFAVSIVLLAVLFLPIRGGLGVSPLNTGSVYFSKIAFANHAAINVIWNFGHSLLEGKESHNPYIFNRNENYDLALKSIYENRDEPLQVVGESRPNIILILLESFSAKLIEPLGGAKGITPRFNELSRKGVLFTNIYSTDSRTDKGLATVLSGYPVLESIPILKYPEKTQRMAFLSKDLIKQGYHCSFMYGGDVDFANIRSYLINGGFNSITDEGDFPSSMRTSKWGVHDHLVYERFLNDIKADTGRWFKVMLSLSNHEPFEIPAKPKFGSRNLTDRFYSSAYYADSCLGDFLQRLKETPVWKNTLVILVADHGTRLPEFDDIFEPRKHHIPLLMTGGAINRDTLISITGSQADIAVTLLKQLGIQPKGYLLGKDLLSASSRSFAFYSIKNGIAMLTDTSGFGYDFITSDLSFSYGKLDTSHISVAKSLQQCVFENYLNLSNH